MPFIHPWLFVGGVAAASVPVIIHLLNRTRFRVIEWAAMRFIRESMRRNRRRVLLEELLLLLLRCLAILLLALAVARFVGCSSRPIPIVSTARQMTHVFILDDSVSMGQKLADATSFRRAAHDLADMLQQVPSGDKVAVLLTSRPARSGALFDLGPLGNAKDLAGRIRQLSVSDTRGRLDRALATARGLFALAEADKRLHVLSDFRRDDYADADFCGAVKSKLQDLRGDEVDLVLMDYGSDAAENLTIDEIKVLNKLTLRSLPIRVQARVRNTGASAAENVAVSFSVCDEEGQEAKLPVQNISAIEPGATRLVHVTCELDRAGSAAVEARLPGDSLAGDNAGYLALRIRNARRVLIADGEPDLSAPELDESHYLRTALDPNGDGGYGSAVKVVSPDGLTEESLDDFELVVLANVGDLPPAPAGGRGPLKALEAYVSAGGGLLIFTGDRLNPTFYNGPFYDGGVGLCPLKIGAPVVDRTRRKFVRLLRGSVANDRVMRSYSGRRSQFTQFVRFYGYTPSAPAPPSASPKLGPVCVLARFDNADVNPVHAPAVAVRRYGKGKVMMICSGADVEWSDWPKDLTFLPFVNDAVEYLSRPGAADAAERVGEPIRFPLPPDMAAAKALLQPPRSDIPVPLTNPRIAARRVLTYADADAAGIYRLLLTLPDEKRTVLFARNVDPAEGRLDKAGPDKLREWLGVEFTYRDQLTPAAAEVAVTSERGEYWKAALAMMLVVLAAEVFLAQRFGHHR
ncbi:MAG: BatA domain-containing protein [Planctomycetota bacterium]|jgi:hypothetical protein